MSRLKWLLAVAGAILAAIVGATARHRRALDTEREKAKVAYDTALEAKNHVVAAKAEADLAAIDDADRQLASKSAVERVGGAFAAAAAVRRERESGR